MPAEVNASLHCWNDMPAPSCTLPAISSFTWPIGAPDALVANARNAKADVVNVICRMESSPGRELDEADIGIISHRLGRESCRHVLCRAWDGVQACHHATD